MIAALTLIATSLAVLAPESHDGPTPLAARRFLVEPDARAVLEWKNVETRAEVLDYIVRDYQGAEQARGKAVATPGGMRVERAFSRGYHEIEFPALDRRFGVIALPRVKGTPDPFFAVDGAMSWLVADDEARSELIALAKGLGLAMVRERSTWGAIQPERGRWDWQSGHRFETLRDSYRRAGMPVLEMAHDAPAWTGLVGKYPDDLVATADSWASIARRWGRTWGGVELWNEPEIAFGGDLPGDQYAAFAKAASFGLRRAGAKAAIVGGVMSHFDPTFLRACQQGGLLDRIDAFSFHDYGPALGFEEVNAKFRNWLRESGRGDMPIWITECGWPWTRGPGRPPADEDRAGGFQIAMKAVEARACGVDRFFAFVLPFYEEDAKNFGLTDRSATPTRSLAAYAQAARALAGLSYLGDLPIEDESLARARVFGDASHAVVVLAASGTDAASRLPVRLAAAPSRVEGADGRPVAVQGGAFVLEDGLAYAWFDRATIDRLVDQKTRAMGLHPRPAASDHRVRPLAPSPIVLRHRIDSKTATPTASGYRLKAGVRSPDLRFDVFNLGDADASLELTLAAEAGSSPGGAEPRRLRVGGRSRGEVGWKLDLADSFASFEPVHILVTAREAGGVRDRIALDLIGEPGLEEALARVPVAVRIPVEDLKRWTPSIGAGGRMNMEAVGPRGWRLSVDHAPGSDRWAYPQFGLPGDVVLAGAKGMILRGRCRRAADVRVFLWEGDSGVGYINATGLFPGDGDWHVVRLGFADLQRSLANADDPDGRLDLGAVRKISLGLNSRADANDLEVSDVYLVR